MDQFRIDTNNAVELYLRDPTHPRAEFIMGTLQRWPRSAAVRHAGLFLACFDALQAKHGRDGGLRNTLRTLAAQWVRKTCPEWKPTWSDYWLLYWTLTKDRPDLARPAIRELHRRGWHLPFAPDHPAWAMAQQTTQGLIRLNYNQHPEFAAAIRAEIRNSPCQWHDEIGVDTSGAA
jgi:hypothetical protein